MTIREGPWPDTSGSRQDFLSALFSCREPLKAAPACALEWILIAQVTSLWGVLECFLAWGRAVDAGVMRTLTALTRSCSRVAAVAGDESDCDTGSGSKLALFRCYGGMGLLMDLQAGSKTHVSWVEVWKQLLPLQEAELGVSVLQGQAY